jgi:hypothetical protein
VCPACNGQNILAQIKIGKVRTRDQHQVNISADDASEKGSTNAPSGGWYCEVRTAVGVTHIKAEDYVSVAESDECKEELAVTTLLLEVCTTTP